MGKMVDGKRQGGIMSRARCAFALNGGPLAAATRKFRHECGDVPLEVSLNTLTLIQNLIIAKGEPDNNMSVLADDEINWDALRLPEAHMSTRTTVRAPSSTSATSTASATTTTSATTTARATRTTRAKASTSATASTAQGRKRNKPISSANVPVRKNPRKK